MLFSVKLMFFLISWSPIRDSNSECLTTTGSKPVNFTILFNRGFYLKNFFSLLKKGHPTKYVRTLTPNYLYLARTKSYIDNRFYQPLHINHKRSSLYFVRPTLLAEEVALLFSVLLPSF